MNERTWKRMPDSFGPHWFTRQIEDRDIADLVRVTRLGNNESEYEYLSRLPPITGEDRVVTPNDGWWLAILDERKTAEMSPIGNDCPGRGKCHGPVQWCDQCGDVDLTCDDPDCEAHLRENEIRALECEAKHKLLAADAEQRKAKRNYDKAAKALSERIRRPSMMVARMMQ